jgi:hypothetical protein
MVVLSGERLLHSGAAICEEAPHRGEFIFFSPPFSHSPSLLLQINMEAGGSSLDLGKGSINGGGGGLHSGIGTRLADPYFFCFFYRFFESGILHHVLFPINNDRGGQGAACYLADSENCFCANELFSFDVINVVIVSFSIRLVNK